MEKNILSEHLSDAFQQPVKVEQYASSVPSEAKVLVRESEHQFTRSDVGRTIDRKMRTGIHYLNPPLTDGLNSVGAIYKALADAAFNYQQEHVTSYYEMFPRLTRVVLTQTELAAADSTWLRLNYRLISTRIAHRIWHYMQVSTMLAAALVNMVNLGRYEGSEVNFKTIASAFRASRINTMTPNYNKFPKPNGVEDYLIANGLYLAGQANDGTPIVSIPLYATDIFGNRGWHHLPGSTFVSLDGKDSLFVTQKAGDPEPANDFLALQFNVSRTILEYAKANQEFDFRMPQIENGGVTYVQDENNLAASVRSGGGGKQSSPHDRWSDGSAFVADIFKNWNSWANYIQKYFADFADVTSDWYRLVTGTLKICAESKTTAEIISAVRSMKYATVENYLQQVKFGASKRATCATIVKYAPYVYNDLGTSHVNTDDFIIANYERYLFWEDDMRMVIRRSLRWPKLTPTTFVSNEGNNDTYTMYVGNTGPNYLPADGLGNGEGIGSYQEEYHGSSPLVYGQRAAYDLVRAVSVDVEVDSVVTIGITKEESLSHASFDTTSKVYDELRSALFVDVLPLIDDTDPYVCGLNYFFAADSALKSQTELTLMDSGNARLVDDLNRVSPGDALRVPKMNDPNFNFGGHDIYPLSEAFDDDLNTDADVPVAAAHIANQGYFDARKHVVVFGGVGICNDVVNAALIQNSGSEFKKLSFKSKVGSVYKAMVASLTATMTNLDDMDVHLAAFVADGTPRYQKSQTSEHNSISAVLAILKTVTDASGDGSNMLAEITLPFTYGAVAIAAQPNPLRSFKTVTNLIPTDTMPGSPGVVPAMQVFQTGYCRKTAQNQYSKDLDYMARVDGYDTSLERSIYGLSHYVAMLVDTDGYVDINREVFTSPVFSLLVDGKLRLMGTTFVKAMGRRNTVAFWDEDHTAIHDLSGSKLAGSIDFKRNDYVAEVTNSQRTHRFSGSNGTTGKQGDSPKFISSNKRSGKAYSSHYNDEKKSTPDKRTGKKRPSGRGRKRDDKLVEKTEQKPFLDSTSNFSTQVEKETVENAAAKGIKPDVIAGM